MIFTFPQKTPFTNPKFIVIILIIQYYSYILMNNFMIDLYSIEHCVIAIT